MTNKLLAASNVFVKYTEFYGNYLTVTVAALITAVFFIPMYGMGFWIIDDHELVFAAHSFNQGIPFFDSLMSTEIGRYLEYSRYRPAYYFFRFLFVKIIGLNAFGYFWVNAATFFSGLALLGFALKRFFPTFTSCLILLFVACLPFHADMWVRLGPSERGAFLFTMLFLFGLSKIDRYPWAWALCCISVTLAIGYKENFVLLLLPLTILAMFRYYILKQSILSNLWLILPYFIGLLVSALIIKITLGQLDHIYQNDISSFAILLKKYVMDIRSLPIYLSFVSFLYFFLVQYDSFKTDKQKTQTFLVCFCTFLATSITALLTFIFYKGSFSLFSRYSFPYYFLCILSMLSAVYPFFLYKYDIYKKAYFFAITPCIIISLFFAFKIFNINMDHAAKVKEFNEFISNNNLALSSALFIPTNHSLYIYEPFYSLKQFAKAGLGPKTVSVDAHLLPAPTEKLDASLKADLLARSIKLPYKFNENMTFVTNKTNSFQFEILSSINPNAKYSNFFIHGNEVYDTNISINNTIFCVTTNIKRVSNIDLIGKFFPDVLENFLFTINGQQLKGILNTENNKITFHTNLEIKLKDNTDVNIVNISITRLNNNNTNNLINGISIL